MRLAKFKCFHGDQALQDKWVVIHPNDFSSAYTDADTGIHYLRLRAGYNHAIVDDPLVVMATIEAAMAETPRSATTAGSTSDGPGDMPS